MNTINTLGWEKVYNNDDFIRDRKTYLKEFYCGSVYNGYHCRLIYQFDDKTLTILLRGERKKVAVKIQMDFIHDFVSPSMYLKELFDLNS